MANDDFQPELTPSRQLLNEEAARQQRVKEAGNEITRFGAGLASTAAGVGRSIATGATVKSAPLLSSIQAGLSSDNFVEGFNEKYKQWVDPDWSPRDKPEQNAAIDETIKELGIDPFGNLANDLRASTSLNSMYLEAEHIRGRLEDLRKVSDLGDSGAVGMFIGGFLDVDALVGLSAISSGVRASRLANAKSLSIAVGGTTAAMEGADALVNPLHDWESAAGAIMLSAGLGGAVGGLLPTSTKQVADELFLSEIAQTEYGPKTGTERPEPQRNFETVQSTIDEANLDVQSSMDEIRAIQTEAQDRP
jgi:hypothetical protein